MDGQRSSSLQSDLVRIQQSMVQNYQHFQGFKLRVFIYKNNFNVYAGVVESVDTWHLKCHGACSVRVRVSSPAPMRR